MLTLQTVGMDIRRAGGDLGFSIVTAERESQDTIHYRNQFIRGSVGVDTSTFLQLYDTIPRLTARDTIFPPDSLKDIDPFRYKYYVALIDSLTHKQVRDSLRQAGDSLDWPVLDSLYYLDSAIRKKAEFEAWYAGLSKNERKKYDFEKKSNLKKHIADSVLNVKDSIKTYKDSVRESIPRILESFAVPDSMKYKRIIQWAHEREFHKMDIQNPDTNYNYRFYDYPFYRKDVNATWLGVSGSALQSYDYFKRGSQNGVSFYDPYESWSYSSATLPMYNTKTPYTELAYFGTLFATSQKESDNLHILTTQNLFPAFNFTLQYDRFGGNGMMDNESTANKTFVTSANYLGKRYLMHAGYIYNVVKRNENGGVSDNTMVSDTTLDAREYPVYLSNASSRLKKHTVFLDQQYRIPFTFIKKAQDKKAINELRDSILATGDTTLYADLEGLLYKRKRQIEAADSTGDENITTAFIGHSSEYSVFRKVYQDQISSSDQTGRDFYNSIFNYNPTSSFDSVRVMKLENRVFIRLQPWSEQGIVSKLNGGIGDRVLNYYSFDPTYITGGSNTVWNSAFVYAGVEGQIKDFIHWDANGDYVFAGNEMNDMSLRANALLTFHPFRRARRSPVSLNLHFETSLDEPEFYNQHYYSNHFSWDNNFDKISTTKLQGTLSIPKWKTELEVGYALLNNNIYYDSTAIIRQNTTPMSVLSASLKKNFTLFNLIHLDNRLLFQVSSNTDVLPLPSAAVNARWYIQFNVKKDIMQMQVGADAWYNTKYYSQAWNPAVGVFYNQNEVKYNNGPVIDAFVNIQWKRACIFIKLENAGQGWPMDKADYFSAHHYIRTQRAIKFGLYWPFFLQPNPNRAVSVGSGLSSGGSGSGGRSGQGNSSSGR